MAKEKPQQDSWRGKISLESNLISARDAQRAQTNLVCTRTPKSPETETELCLSVSCGDTGQQRTVAGEGTLGTVDLGMA